MPKGAKRGQKGTMIVSVAQYYPVSTKFPQSRIAVALADLTIMTQRESAKKHGISIRSLKRYKADLDPASPLAAEVQNINNNRDTSWAAELPDTLREALAVLRVHISNPNFDPKQLNAIVNSIKVLNGIEMTRKVFKARFDL